MRSPLRWRTELRADGVWEPLAPRLAGLLPALVMGASLVFKYPGDGWLLGAASAFLALGLWAAGFFRWGLQDRLLFGICQRGADGAGALVAGRQRIPLATIERLEVHGPLARREVTVYPAVGMPMALLTGWTEAPRGLAERYLAAHRRQLPFAVDIRAPESPFLQPDTLF